MGLKKFSERLGLTLSCINSLRWGIGKPILVIMMALGIGFWYSIPAQANGDSLAGTDALLASLAAEGFLLDEAHCGANYRLLDTELCTHGADEVPPEFEIHQPVQPLVAGAAASAPFCDGDGTSGERVEVLYVRAENVTDRYNQYVDSFRIWAADIDHMIDNAAHETGGHRHVRFVTDSSCTIVITPVVVPTEADSSFSQTIAALQSLGYNRNDRKYLMFVDANVYCGIGTVKADTNPTDENVNNLARGYARVDSGCWSGEVAAHELIHTLGGVQHDAPNATGGWHCTDEWDLMCYADTPFFPTMSYICPSSNRYRIDCNHDDYFHTNPEADSYLATHWNVANSKFLAAVEEEHHEPPTIQISMQASSSAFVAPAVIAFQAQVSATGSTVSRVEYYRDNVLLGTSVTTPFGFEWAHATAGTHTIVAKVYDALDASATSPALIVQVVEPPAPTRAPSPTPLPTPSQTSEPEPAPIVGSLYLPLVLSPTSGGK